MKMGKVLEMVVVRRRKSKSGVKSSFSRLHYDIHHLNSLAPI